MHGVIGARLNMIGSIQQENLIFRPVLQKIGLDIKVGVGCIVASGDIGVKILGMEVGLNYSVGVDVSSEAHVEIKF